MDSDTITVKFKDHTQVVSVQVRMAAGMELREQAAFVKHALQLLPSTTTSITTSTSATAGGGGGGERQSVEQQPPKVIPQYLLDDGACIHSAITYLIEDEKRHMKSAMVQELLRDAAVSAAYSSGIVSNIPPQSNPTTTPTTIATTMNEFGGGCGSGTVMNNEEKEEVEDNDDNNNDDDDDDENASPPWNNDHIFPHVFRTVFSSSEELARSLMMLEQEYFLAVSAVDAKREEDISDKRNRQVAEMDTFFKIPLSNLPNPKLQKRHLLEKHEHEINQLESYWTEEIASLKRKQRKDFRAFVHSVFEEDPGLQKARLGQPIPFRRPYEGPATSSDSVASSSKMGSGDLLDDERKKRNGGNRTRSDPNNNNNNNNSKLNVDRKGSTSPPLSGPSLSLPYVLQIFNLSPCSHFQVTVYRDVPKPSASLEKSSGPSKLASTLTLSVSCAENALSRICAYRNSIDIHEDSHSRDGDATALLYEQRMLSTSSLFGNRLCALVVPCFVVDDTSSGRMRLRMDTRMYRDMLRHIGSSTDFHFDSIQMQLDRIREDFARCADTGESCQTGRFFITKHSNAPLVHIMFHMLVNTRDSVKDRERYMQRGLANVFSTCETLGVETFTIFTNFERELSRASDPSLNDTLLSLQEIVRAYLLAFSRRQQSSSPPSSALKVFQLVIPHIHASALGMAPPNSNSETNSLTATAPYKLLSCLGDVFNRISCDVHAHIAKIT